ncbi:MAG TPA: hypothetical protein VJZ75_03550, partial [Candidatus Bathyarchaeia archaeon]|nr:hypothetical protein [Candidatus Bathyarchaeia archaeon]
MKRLRVGRGKMLLFYSALLVTIALSFTYGAGPAVFSSDQINQYVVSSTLTTITGTTSLTLSVYSTTTSLTS